VTFNVTNDAGQTVSPSMMGRLGLVMAGNTGDFSKVVSENPSGATPATGGFAYTFQAPIPADATGSWAVGIEGYQNASILTREGAASVQDAGDNKVFYFPVTDTVAVPRRQVVALSKCNTCHNALSLHGDNRNNVEHCVLCHNPNATDVNRRPGDKGLPESVHFKVMIHKIHSGEELGEAFVVYGFGGTPHNFGEVRFPGDRRKCDICHVDGTQQLPLREGLLATQAPRELINPLPPVTGACLSCHRDLSAAAHAELNTSPNLGEACAVCHKEGADFSVDRVHAQ
jgi:OmcA/MtrC family decaheme c-type cytochrome